MPYFLIILVDKSLANKSENIACEIKQKKKTLLWLDTGLTYMLYGCKAYEKSDKISKESLYRKKSTYTKISTRKNYTTQKFN